MRFVTEVVTGKNEVIPFAIKDFRYQADGGRVFIGDFAYCRIGIRIVLAVYDQFSLGGGYCNLLEDDGIVGEWIASYVLIDPSKKTMLNLVPLARS